MPDLHNLGNHTYVSGTEPGSSIWLRQRKPNETSLYLSIICDSNQAVDNAYAAAIKASGAGENKPTNQTYFTPGYYTANVADFDGNHLQVVAVKVNNVDNIIAEHKINPISKLTFACAARFDGGGVRTINGLIAVTHNAQIQTGLARLALAKPDA